ncbi:hypothetical protein ENSA5_41300 [Enhygromyxa salina]|uniref:Uncharacterized protein n=1 Tax=Enhygromyxa salina TaxID=215803 RepID=A0A2S9XMU2_9BACT|nr:hypothetical protein [Enhygromyxa salina]PRP94175.1 hypothetical protein ENSA5_41300 [Enhygromyxa salina]
MPSSGRRYEQRYPEREAAQILERAAELQRQANDNTRMTVSELEEAASPAGIAAVYVRRAAAELSLRQARRDRVSPGLGGPRTILLEVTLDGELPVPAYEYVIEVVRRHTGELGVASLIGRSLTWTAHPSHSRAGPGWSRTIAVTIVPRSGRTCIRIEEKLDQLVKSVFGTLLGGVGGGGSVLPCIPLALVGLPGLIPLGMGLWIAGFWSLGRAVYKRRVEARERELHGALEAILEIAEDYMSPPRLTEG